MIDKVDVTTTGDGDLLPEVDARALAEQLGPRMLDYLEASIKRSADPETGAPKRALSPRSSKVPRKGGRGYATGELAEGLTLEVKGRGAVATLVVRVPASRHVFVVREAGRGVKYLSTEGLAGRVVEEVVDEFLEGVADG